MARNRALQVGLQVPDTDLIHEKLKRIAQREHVSMASVIRELIRAGLPEREAQSKRLFPDSPE